MTNAPDLDLDLPPEAATEPATAEALIPLADLNTEIVRIANQLSAARGVVISLQAKQRQTRQDLGKAVSTFTTGLVPKTREQLMREHIASEQLRKQDVKDGKIPTQRGSINKPGPSVIDRSAFYSRGGSANQRGGGAYRRGGYTIESKGGANMDARRGPVAAPKVPSDS